MWLIFTYLFTTEYSSRQKLLDSNLESSTRITRHSPTRKPPEIDLQQYF